jgi:hypothetical protein
MLRVVLDTNILVSAFLYGGIPLDVLDLAESSLIELYTSEAALSELLAVLSRSEFQPRLRSLRLSANTIVALYAETANVIAPAPPPRICSDPADDAFIGIAVAAEADLIVSGDRHLLACSESSPVPVVTASELLRVVESIR